MEGLKKCGLQSQQPGSVVSTKMPTYWVVMIRRQDERETNSCELVLG